MLPLSENSYLGINFSVLMEIPHSYLKELSPKLSTGVVSFWVAMFADQPKQPLLNSDRHHSQVSKGYGLTNFVTILFLN